MNPKISQIAESQFRLRDGVSPFFTNLEELAVKGDR